MKYLALLFIGLIGFTAQFSEAWSCNTDLGTIRDDASERSKCVYRVLNHFLQEAEWGLIQEYKSYVPNGNINQIRNLPRRKSTFEKYVDDIIKYQTALNLKFPGSRDIYIKNTVPIPLQCPVVSSSSD